MFASIKVKSAMIIILYMLILLFSGCTRTKHFIRVREPLYLGNPKTVLLVKEKEEITLKDCTVTPTSISGKMVTTRNYGPAIRIFISRNSKIDFLPGNVVTISLEDIDDIQKFTIDNYSFLSGLIILFALCTSLVSLSLILTN